ncbi:MAG: WG repeat-containing protein [Chloroherpetonaceae bacterium]|nr:WG repeat-containing protein [Chloroherpetonaceae bacterium]MDW8437661.1 WG repeat-containing protein [Chloroherpetonaceae bacterium]
MNSNYTIEKKFPASEGISRVIVSRSDNRDAKGENFMNSAGDLLSKERDFLKCLDFSEGYGGVMLNRNSANFIDSKGNFLSDENFNFIEISRFSEGFSLVRKAENYKWNYIDKHGRMLSKIDFSRGSHFSQGFAAVKIKDGEWNFIDKNGNFLLKETVTHASSFSCGYARIKSKNKLWNYVNANGEFLFRDDERITEAEDFRSDVCLVKMDNGCWKFFDVNKNEISCGLDILSAKNFINDFAIIETKKGFNYLKKDGKVLCPDIWFSQCSNFSGDFAVVRTKNGSYNYVSIGGQLISNEGFSWAKSWRKKGYGEVSLGSEKRYIDANGEIFNDLSELLRRRRFIKDAHRAYRDYLRRSSST